MALANKKIKKIAFTIVVPLLRPPAAGQRRASPPAKPILRAAPAR
jgi:hypothetical protein